MARYEKYKDSGEQWLGQVPDHWEIIKGRGVFEENVETNKDLSENTVLSLSYGKIIKKRDINEGLVPADYRGYQIVNPDYIIIRCTDLQNDKVSLRTAISKYRGIITGAYLGLIVKPKYNPDFMHYYLHTWDITKEIYRHGGGLRQVLSWEDVKYLTMLIPPKDEQNAIVSYLDSACDEIDKAIAQQQRMIDLLNERKQIIIQNAAIKGLDPDVPMKDSGVDWIGDIPAHWEWTANKFIFRPYKKIVGKKAKDYTLLSLSKQGVIKRDLDNPTGKFPTSFDTYQEVNPGDFIFCFFDNEETPRTVGLSTYRGMITGAYDVLKVINKEFDARYLLYYFLTIDEAKRFRPLWRGLRKTIPFDSFMKYKIAQPPLEEQKRIVTYLDLQMQEIDRGILNMEKTIETLQERKRIIINDVVTGKIKVS